MFLYNYSRLPTITVIPGYTMTSVLYRVLYVLYRVLYCVLYCVLYVYYTVYCTVCCTVCCTCTIPCTVPCIRVQYTLPKPKRLELRGVTMCALDTKVLLHTASIPLTFISTVVCYDARVSPNVASSNNASQAGENKTEFRLKQWLQTQCKIIINTIEMRSTTNLIISVCMTVSFT